MGDVLIFSFWSSVPKLSKWNGLYWCSGDFVCLSVCVYRNIIISLTQLIPYWLALHCFLCDTKTYHVENVYWIWIVFIKIHDYSVRPLHLQ